MPKRPLLPAICVALVVACAAPALAEGTRTVSVIGGNVVLPIPNGYCALSESNAADKQMISLIERVNAGRNKVLMLFADCAQLQAYRTAGADISKYGSYLAPMSAKRPVNMPRAAFAKVIGEQFQKQKALIEKAQQEAKRRVQNAAPGVALQDNQNLGLIHQDDTGAFTGLIQKWQAEGSGPTRLATVSGLTLVRGRIVSMNLAAPHTGKTTVAGLLTAQRDNIKKLISVN